LDSCLHGNGRGSIPFLLLIFNVAES